MNSNLIEIKIQVQLKLETTNDQDKQYRKEPALRLSFNKEFYDRGEQLALMRIQHNLQLYKKKIGKDTRKVKDLYIEAYEDIVAGAICKQLLNYVQFAHPIQKHLSIKNKHFKIGCQKSFFTQNLVNISYKAPTLIGRVAGTNV